MDISCCAPRTKANDVVLSHKTVNSTTTGPRHIEKVSFIGPAQVDLKSLPEQANFFLNTYWPYWKDYSNPASYIIPPVFSYKRPNESDKKFEKAKQRKDAVPDPIIKDRESDEAEILVYNAIYGVINDKVRAPFVAVRGLNMDRTRYALSRIFPHLRWKHLQRSLETCFTDECAKYQQAQDQTKKLEIGFQNSIKRCFQDGQIFCFKELQVAFGELQQQNQHSLPKSSWDLLKKKTGEYLREIDFLLIGPEIGIIAIEVKHSYFTQAKHFSKETKYLPEDFWKGLEQLKSVDTLFEFFQECIDFQMPSRLQTRKILFTPNLERVRFEKWLSNLDQHNQSRIRAMIGETTLWLKEDAKNVGNHAEKVPLYSSLMKEFESAIPVSIDVYEAFAPVMVGLASLIISRDASVVSAQLLSMEEAVFQVHTKMLTNNPTDAQKKAKKAKTVSDEIHKTTFLERSTGKAILLTPDQQKALGGPCRQFIFGAAGTGKTIVLQEKAIRLLRQGESVILLSPKSFMTFYSEFFEANVIPSEQYMVREWPSWSGLSDLHIMAEKFNSNFAGDYKGGVIWSIYEYVQRILETCYWRVVFGWLSCSQSHLLIDDAFDEDTYMYGRMKFMISSLAIMAYAEQRCPERIIWIATDVYEWNCDPGSAIDADNDVSYNKLRMIPEMLWHGSSELGRYFWSVALTEVMRCPENIFNRVFKSKSFWPKELRPCLSHKIRGRGLDTPSLIHGSSFENAKVSVWSQLVTEVKQLLDHGLSPRYIAIIFGDFANLTSDIERFIETKLSEKGNIEVACSNRGPYRLHIGQHELIIYDWHEVSSREWPIVIYAACSPRENGMVERFKMNKKYRAVSRATVQAIEIIATYDRDPAPTFAAPSHRRAIRIISAPPHTASEISVTGLRSTRDYITEMDRATFLKEELNAFGQVIASRLSQINDGIMRRKTQEAITKLVDDALEMEHNRKQAEARENAGHCWCSGRRT